MKNNCCLKLLIGLILFSGYFSYASIQKRDTIIINSEFRQVNIKDYAKVNGEQSNDNRNYFYFGFQNEYNHVLFTVKNTESKAQTIVLELSNTIIQEIILSKAKGENKVIIEKTGIDYSVSKKPMHHRLFAFQLELKPYEKATYELRLKKEKGKPLVTSIDLKEDKTFNADRDSQYIVLGLYFGISLLSVFFCVFIFYYLRKLTYILYALYIIFLGLYISSYTGLFSQFFLNQSDQFDKYIHYVLFSEVALVLFVLFSQKILETKSKMPKLKKAIDIMLMALISIRLLIHFVVADLLPEYISWVMQLWYAVFISALVVIAIQIALYFKTNVKRSSLFALAYIFMVLGVCFSILYHSYGLVNSMLNGLPILFYSSFLEIVFLTFTIVLMVKSIYDERNLLSEKVIIEERKNLTAFIRGEDQERERISKELHDNIGSKLSYLRRFVADSFKDQSVNDAVDSICDDVRNLSHEISPSDLKLVGFKTSVEDLAHKLSKQTDLNVNFNSYQFPENLDENTKIQLYRTVQEAINNCIKHANANHIDIQLMGHETNATVSIEDDGTGFDSATQNRGIGLKNMTSRIHQIGGKISIDSKIGNGTSILIDIPV